VIDEPLLGFADIYDQSLDTFLEQDRFPDCVAQISPKAHEGGNGNGQTSPDWRTASRTSARLRSIVSSK
jgi:hypothetical protein